MKKRHLFLIVIFLFLTVTERIYALNLEIFTASDFDTEDQRFHFIGVGLINPLTGQFSVFPRVMAGFYRYKFKSDANILDAELQTIMPAVGIRYSQKGYSSAIIAGADFRRTEREKVGGGKETEDEQGAIGQLELDIWPSAKANLNVILNFSSVDEFFWSRVRVKRDIAELFKAGKNIFAGIEAIVSGNEDFQAWQIGIFKELALSGKLYITGKAGYKRSTDIGDSAYFGFDLYLIF